MPHSKKVYRSTGPHKSACRRGACRILPWHFRPEPICISVMWATTVVILAHMLQCVSALFNTTVRWEYSLGLNATLANPSKDTLRLFSRGAVLTSQDASRVYASTYSLPFSDAKYITPSVFSLDATTGALLWKYQPPNCQVTFSGFIGPSTLHTNYLFLTATGATLYYYLQCDGVQTTVGALNGVSGAVVWQVVLPDNFVFPPLYTFETPLPGLSSQGDLWVPLGYRVSMITSGGATINIPVSSIYNNNTWLSGFDPSRSFLVVGSYIGSTSNSLSTYDSHTGAALWQTNISFGDSFPIVTLSSTSAYALVRDKLANSATLHGWNLATGALVSGLPVQLPSSLYLDTNVIKVTPTGGLLFVRSSDTGSFSLALVSSSGLEQWSVSLATFVPYPFGDAVISADGTSVLVSGSCTPLNGGDSCLTGTTVTSISLATGVVTQAPVLEGILTVFLTRQDPSGGGGALGIIGRALGEGINYRVGAFSPQSGSPLWVYGEDNVVTDTLRGVSQAAVGGLPGATLLASENFLTCLNIPAGGGGGGGASSAAASFTQNVGVVVGGTLGGLALVGLGGAALFLYRGALFGKGVRGGGAGGAGGGIYEETALLRGS